MKNLLILLTLFVAALAQAAYTPPNPNGQAAAASSAPVTLSNENVQDLNITGAATQTASGNNIVLASAGTGSTDANGYRAVSIQINITGTVTSGVVTFEGSNDNTNFFAVSLYDPLTPQNLPATTVSPATSTNYIRTGPLQFRYFRARISTVIGGGGSIAAVTRFSQVGTYPVIPSNNPAITTRRTYRAVANVSLAASATDAAILPGNATNTIYVTRVIVSGVQTTAGLVDVALVKRSTANSAGTSAAMTAVPLNAADAAAVSAPLSYTANPTTGTAIGTIDRTYVPFGPTSASTAGAIVFDFGSGSAKPVVLSGTAQGLAVNFNGVTVTGGAVTVVFEWIELP